MLADTHSGGRATVSIVERRSGGSLAGGVPGLAVVSSVGIWAWTARQERPCVANRNRLSAGLAMCVMRYFSETWEEFGRLHARDD
jgi:hypothetical protein